MSVQGDDVEGHRGDVHGEPLGVGQQEAEGAAELPLALQRVDQSEGQAQRVDQQVGCREEQRSADGADRDPGRSTQITGLGGAAAQTPFRDGLLNPKYVNKSVLTCHGDKSCDSRKTSPNRRIH